MTETRFEWALGERVKELSCLYGIATLVEQRGDSLDDLLQAIVEILPPSWQYPLDTVARIVHQDRVFTTARFRETPWALAADILVSGEPVGRVEVYYLKERPAKDVGPFLKEEVDLIEGVAERIGTVTKRISTELALGERVKELSCLYSIARLVEQRGDSLDDLLQAIVEILPPSWQYPPDTVARIVHQGRVFTTARFRETPWVLAADILVSGEPIGRVEVYYLEERPAQDVGAFLNEEVDLIEGVAERIGYVTRRMTAEQQLQAALSNIETERNALQAANLALKTVLGSIEDEKQSIRMDINTNVDRVLMPLLQSLELNLPRQFHGFVRLLRQNLLEITSPLMHRLTTEFDRLTPTEIAICNMIRTGFSSKEIAALRAVSLATIHRHREHIRGKLGLTNHKTNLASFLERCGRLEPKRSR